MEAGWWWRSFVDDGVMMDGRYRRVLVVVVRSQQWDGQSLGTTQRQRGMTIPLACAILD
jgi:hypothetical protein